MVESLTIHKLESDQQDKSIAFGIKSQNWSTETRTDRLPYPRAA